MDTRILIQDQEHVTISTACRLLNLKKSMIYYYLHQEKLKSFRIDGLILISLSSLNDLNVYRHFRTKKQSNEK